MDKYQAHCYVRNKQLPAMNLLLPSLGLQGLNKGHRASERQKQIQDQTSAESLVAYGPKGAIFYHMFHHRPLFSNHY